MKKQNLLTLFFGLVMMLFANVAFAQPGDPCGGCPPDQCNQCQGSTCTFRAWTVAGTNSPTAGTLETYTVSTASVAGTTIKANTITITITAASNSLFKVLVDGTLYTFSANQSRTFSKSIADCSATNSVSWSLEFVQSGRSGTIALTGVTGSHTIGTPSSISFTTL
jgi:hypothetical protein